MRNVILCVTLLLGYSLLNKSNAQAKEDSCIVRGQLQNESGSNVQGATIQIIKAKDSLVLFKAVSDVSGRFEASTYCEKVWVKITAVGYETYMSREPFASISEGLNVELKTAFRNLAGVEVRSARRNVEVRPDRMIVNVEAGASNAGANVLEVLEKSPGLAVDQDGTISMQGKQGVLVLIDGKRSQLNNTELAALLRSMSSAQIDQIELITQPSSRYDASGNAGVINIKLKKSRVAKFNGTIASSITQGKYTRLNQNITLDQRIGNATVSLGYTGAYLKGFFDFSINRKIINPTDKEDYFDQRTLSLFRQIPQNIRLTIDYALNKKTTVALNNTLFISNHKDAPTTNSFNLLSTGKSMEQSIGSNHIKRFNYAIGFNLRKLIDSMGKELTIDGDYFSYDRRNNQFLNSDMYDDQRNNIRDPYYVKGFNPSAIQIIAGKVDYIHPITKRWRTEAGLKISDITTNNKADFARMINNSWEPDARGNDFTYSETIMAGYINLFATLSNWKVQSGLRTEATSVRALERVQTSSRTSDYIDLFPTLSVSYEKKKGHVYSAYYSKRIDRPNYQDMNPFQFVLNRYTYSQGNPRLIAQYTSIAEAGYAYKNNFNIKASYSYTRDIIGDVIYQDVVTKIAYQQKVNMAKRKLVSINSTYIIPVNKVWTSTVFANAFHTSYSGQFNNSILKNDSYSFNFNINNQFRFSKGWTAELSASYFHKNYFTALFFDRGMSIINAGLAKQVIGGKGTLRIAARDIFHTQYNRYTIDLDNIAIRLKQRQDATNITVGFTYRFGKTTINQRRRSGSASDEINRVGGS